MKLSKYSTGLGARRSDTQRPEASKSFPELTILPRDPLAPLEIASADIRAISGLRHRTI
jgi:hypothetical protein